MCLTLPEKNPFGCLYLSKVVDFLLQFQQFGIEQGGLEPTLLVVVLEVLLVKLLRVGRGVFRFRLSVFRISVLGPLQALLPLLGEDAPDEVGGTVLGQLVGRGELKNLLESKILLR